MASAAAAAALATQYPTLPATATGSSNLMNLYGSYATPKSNTYPTYTGVR